MKMEKEANGKLISRRNLFASAGMFLTGAAVSAAGCSMLKPPPVVAPAVKTAAWPYPYKKIDPERVRKLAHKGYYKGK